MKLTGILTDLVMFFAMISAACIIVLLVLIWAKKEDDTKIISYRVSDCVAFRADYAERKDEAQRFRVEYSTAESFTIRVYPAPLHRPMIGYEVPKDLAYYFTKIDCHKKGAS